jgi:site-specific DNA-methyltransferase (adenine-specific)
VTLPTPYYADAHVSLYHGDCLELLPHVGEVDHVITDPPYEAEAHTKARRSSRGLGVLAEKHEIDFAPIDEETRDSIAAYIAGLCRGWALVFCQAEAIGKWRECFEAYEAKWVRAQAWIKPDGSPQFTGDRPAQGWEAIATAWCGRRRMHWNGEGRRGVYTHCVNNAHGLSAINHGTRTKIEHPTTKPLALMRELVRLFTDPGDLILDCFAGSGTTGLAARLEGRRAILIEREERYCAVAARRLEHMPSETSAGQLSLLAGGER